MGRLALGIVVLVFGALVGVAAAQSTATTTTTSRTVTTKLTTTVTEPPKTTTATRTETALAKTVTAPARTSSVTVSTTPASKNSSGSSVPWWAWALIGIGAVGTGTAIYLAGHDRGRNAAAEGPDRRGAGAPPGPGSPGG